MRHAALGFGLCFVLGFLLLFGNAHFRTLIFLVIVFDLQEDLHFRPTRRLLAVLVLLVGGTLSLDWFVAALALWLVAGFPRRGFAKENIKGVFAVFQKRQSLWAGDCVGSNLGTVVSGANGSLILAEEDKQVALLVLGH
jgi:hypothetical protein